MTSHFAERHGGAPEAILSLARLLGGLGVETDVLSRAGLHPAVDRLPGLPLAAAEAEPGGRMRMADYAGLAVVGAWNRHALPWILAARREGRPVVYAPKGGLANAEFSRPSDLLKLAYFLLVEQRVLRLSRRAVLSSEAERRALIAPARRLGGGARIVPEPFAGLPLGPAAAPKRRAGGLTVGFLAEISARKGLDLLLRGLCLYGRREDARPVTLRIGGKFRRGEAAHRRVVERLIAGAPSNLSVEWTGPVAAAEREDFYRGVDLFACTSRFESFGLAPLEALWFGAPCLVGPDVGVLEFLPADAAVLRLPSLAPPAISAAIAEVHGRRQALEAAAAAWRGRLLPALSGPGLGRQWLEALELSPA